MLLCLRLASPFAAAAFDLLASRLLSIRIKLPHRSIHNIKKKVHLSRKKHHKYLSSSISLRRLFFFYDSFVLKNLISFHFCNAHFIWFTVHSRDTYASNTGRLRYLNDVLFLIIAVGLTTDLTVLIGRCQHGRNVIVRWNIATVHLLATWHKIFISLFIGIPFHAFPGA